MKTLKYSAPHDLSQLHDELLAAIPALRGEDAPGQPLLRVEGEGTTVVLTVPEATSEAALVAVVKAHDPTVASASERQATERTAAHTDLHLTATAAMTRLDAIISGGGAYAAAEVRAATVDMARIQRQALRYLAARLSG